MLNFLAGLASSALRVAGFNLDLGDVTADKTLVGAFPNCEHHAVAMCSRGAEGQRSKDAERPDTRTVVAGCDSGVSGDTCALNIRRLNLYPSRHDGCTAARSTAKKGHFPGMCSTQRFGA